MYYFRKYLWWKLERLFLMILYIYLQVRTCLMMREVANPFPWKGIARHVKVNSHLILSYMKKLLSNCHSTTATNASHQLHKNDFIHVHGVLRQHISHSLHLLYHKLNVKKNGWWLIHFPKLWGSKCLMKTMNTMQCSLHASSSLAIHPSTRNCRGQIQECSLFPQPWSRKFI